MDKDQILESGREKERQRGEIIESREESSSISMSLIFVRNGDSNLRIGINPTLLPFFEGKVEILGNKAKRLRRGQLMKPKSNVGAIP